MALGARGVHECSAKILSAACCMDKIVAAAKQAYLASARQCTHFAEEEPSAIR